MNSSPIKPGTTVYYVRTDVAPGMRQPSDILKAQGLISGGCGRQFRGPADPPDARHARRAISPCHRLSQQQDGAARAAAGRDQLFAESAAGLSQRGDTEHWRRPGRCPALLRPRLQRRDASTCRSRWTASTFRRSRISMRRSKAQNRPASSGTCISPASRSIRRCSAAGAAAGRAAGGRRCVARGSARAQQRQGLRRGCAQGRRLRAGLCRRAT